MNKFILFVFIILSVVNLKAQDLSNVDLSKLSPEQVAMYKQYMASKGGSANTTNVKDVNADDRGMSTDKVDSKPAVEMKSESKASNANNNQVFGSYLFNTQNLTFEPQLNIATPANYVLGTSDEVVVDVSGLYEANYKLKVSPEGTIRIPNVGPVRVAGKTIQDATKSIQSQVSGVYQGVDNGDTRIAVTLGNIRSIRVTVVGNAVRPGTYTVPSLATAFNLLYACGGPNEKGSMRQISVIRNAKVISIIDVYKFLTDGVLKNNVILQEGDVLKIDPVKSRISLKGNLNHTGKFENISGETLTDLIRYAGGFAENAFTEIATVIRIQDNQRIVIDVPATQFNSFKLAPGDEYSFSEIMDKFKNRIDIKGAVNRPGVYALTDGMTLKQLIDKASGLREDAFLNRAFITRKRDNLVPEVLSFNLANAINGKSEVLLHKDDQIEIKSLFDYRQDFEVSISGEVQSPGTFPFVENMTLLDLISQAKGFTDIALTDSVELIRIVKDKDKLLLTGQKTIVKKYKIDKDLMAENSQGSIVLETGDQVVVRKISGYEAIRMVTIEGEVMRPGGYNVISKSDYISDLIKRAGGLTQYAYPSGAFLVRNQKLDNAQRKLNTFMTENAVTQLQKSSSTNIDADVLQKAGLNPLSDLSAIDSVQNQLNGSGVIQKIENTEGLVGINLKQIIRNPRGKFDLKLEEGDLIYIPRELQTVKVIGEVYFPTYVRFQTDLSLREYLNSAGGVSTKANRNKIFVLYPNGTSKSTKSFLGIRTYPKVLPGAQILVPQKQLEIKSRMTTGETISVLSSVTSMAAIVYSIIQNTQSNSNGN